MDALDQWRAKLEDLPGLWRSIRLASICLRDGDVWINLLGTFDVSTDLPAQNDDPSRVIELPSDLLAIEASLPIAAMPQLIEDLRIGKISVRTSDEYIRLFVDSNKKGYWNNPRTQERPFALRDMGIDFTTIFLDYVGPELNPDLFPYDRREGIDKKLRIRVPPFDGLAGLARSMGLVPLGQGVSNACLRLTAPLPLKFRSTWHSLHDGRLIVRVEAPPFIDLDKAHVSGVDAITQAPLILGALDSWQRLEEESTVLFEKTVQVPRKKGRIRLFLAYNQAQADTREIYLSSINAWTRACEFFDPGLTHTWDLKSARTKMSVSALEMGALRVVATVGFRTAWFGKEAEERKPDILACHELADGRRAFLIVECTEENPTSKFNKVADEARSLSAFLDDAACEVIPTVYTAAECSQPDRQNAVMQGVALIGASDAAEILELLRAGQTTETILALIEGLRSNAPWILSQLAPGPVGPTG